MELIKQADIDLIQLNANKEVDPTQQELLKEVYDKLDYLCKVIVKRGFEYSIRRDPRKQAGPGKFKFQEYQWAQVFPKGFKSFCNKRFGYIVGLSNSLQFHMMGFTDLQNHPLSREVSKKCWTEIPLNSSYDLIADEFEKFDKKYRDLLISAGAELGIKELKQMKEQQKMEASLNLLLEKKHWRMNWKDGKAKLRSGA